MVIVAHHKLISERITAVKLELSILSNIWPIVLFPISSKLPECPGGLCLLVGSLLLSTWFLLGPSFFSSECSHSSNSIFQLLQYLPCRYVLFNSQHHKLLWLLTIFAVFTSTPAFLTFHQLSPLKSLQVLPYAPETLLPPTYSGVLLYSPIDESLVGMPNHFLRYLLIIPSSLLTS